MGFGSNKNQQRKGRWAKWEDDLLKTLVTEHSVDSDDIDWSILEKHFDGMRDSKQIRERWVNHLTPSNTCYYDESNLSRSSSARTVVNDNYSPNLSRNSSLKDKTCMLSNVYPYNLIWLVELAFRDTIFYKNAVYNEPRCPTSSIQLDTISLMVTRHNFAAALGSTGEYSIGASL
ncbi:7025_t:CDS:2 [Funneliformis caledonium]|uniref:7025_t:CDS:1 n=1 Tax=Funneliformis caledonium TaxID=1117310 RepID=A0A9N9CU71_9GLOM|nr:7025_t:CDS:2 [Funneliformis caledonium]